MSNIRNRIAKAEAKAQLREDWINDRKAKLREIERLENDNPIAACILQRELETGRKYSLALLIAELTKSSAANAEATE